MLEVREADFERDLEALRLVRNTVFVEEQLVPLEIEYDDRDPHCHHILAFFDNQPIGTGRIDFDYYGSGDGKIGRVAVLKVYRGKGIGEQLMLALQRIASNAGLQQVRLNAQVSALAFYKRLGYLPVGEAFVEAGIDHQAMVLTLKPVASLPA